jgi:hemoglobin
MNHARRIRAALLLSASGAAVVLSLSSPLAAQENTDTAKAKPLYERLGGRNAIVSVVDQFVANVAADTAINRYFAHTNTVRLKAMLVDQICQATGGPCKYRGKDMKSTHRGMGITTKEFNDLVGDLVRALDKFHVGEKEKSDLLSALGPMKRDIVEKP